MEQTPSGGTPEQPRYFYDSFSGQLLLGQIAMDTHIEAGGHPADIQELRYLLLDNQPISVPADLMNVRSWDKQDCLNYGKWISNYINPGFANGVRSRTLDRAYRLGLGPSDGVIRDPSRFGKLSLFQEELGLNGIRRVSAFNGWAFGDFIEHLRKVGEEEGKRPSLTILLRRIAEGKVEPHPKIIRNRIGSMHEAYELAGFVYVRYWNKEKFLGWGADFLDANGRVPAVSDINRLSALQRGPSTEGIYNRFGSLIKFQDELPQVLESRRIAEQQAWDMRLKEIEDGIATRTLPRELFEELESELESTERMARYKVVTQLMSSLRRSQRVTLSLYPFLGKDFVKHLQRYDTSISVWGVEDAAKSSNCLSVLFPRDDFIKSLHVGEILARQNQRTGNEVEIAA